MPNLFDQFDDGGGTAVAEPANQFDQFDSQPIPNTPPDAQSAPIPSGLTKSQLLDLQSKQRFNDSITRLAEPALNVATPIAEDLTPSAILNTPQRLVKMIAPDSSYAADVFHPDTPTINIPQPTGTGILAGLGKLGAQTLSGFTTPESIVTLPVAAQSALIRTIFGTQMAANLPAGVSNAINVLKDPNATTADKIVAVGNPTVQAAMIGALSFLHPKNTSSEPTEPSTQPNENQVEQPAEPAAEVENQPGVPVVEPPAPTAHNGNAAVAAPEPQPAPADEGTDASVSQPVEQPALQPAIRVGDKILTGGGDTHMGIALAHGEDINPDDPLELPTKTTMRNDPNVESGFVDVSNPSEFLTRDQAKATGVFGDSPPQSESLPGFGSGEFPEKKVTPIASDVHGGSQEDLPTDQQAISKANNSREAFARVQAEADAKKQSPGNGLPLIENTKNAPVAEVRTPAQSSLEGGGNPTAMKYRLIDQERQQRGLPPVAKGESVSDQVVLDRATDAIDKNPELPNQLVDELNKKPRPISDVENHVLLLRKIDLRNQFQDAANEQAKAQEAGDQSSAASASVRLANLSDKLNDLENASDISGSARGSALRSLQVMANEDYSLAGLETRLRASKGAPLTDAERAELVKTAADYKKSNDELTKHLADQDKQISDLHVKAALDQIALDAKKPNAPAAPKRSGILDTLKARADAARARINARPAQLSAGIDPTLLLKSLRDEIEIGAYHIARIGTDVAKLTSKNLDAWKESMKKEFGERIVPHLAAILDAAKKTVDDLNKPATHEEKIAAQSAKIKEKFTAGKRDEITSQVQKLARTFIERGITGRDALIDAVHNVLKESDPEITRRETMDAISGYGDFKQLSKDEISKKLRDLKGQMQQVGKLEDIQSKRPPLKSGVERRTPSDEERKLIQQVNEAKRQHGITVTDPETQLKSALDARKTYYKNQITDLEKQIASREKFVKTKTPSPTDLELVALKAKRETLKKEFDDIFNPKKTDTQKYQDALAAEKKSLEKSISEKQKKLSEGDLSASPREMNRPADPTLEPLKQQRDALNKELSKARADAAKKPEAQKYAEALQRRLDAMNKSIAEKEARIKSGNVEPSTVARQNRPLSPELEQAKQKLDALNKQIDELKNPKKSDVEKLRDRIQKSIKSMEDKIASGDFEKRAPKPPIVDRKAQELTAQKEAVAKKFKRMQHDYEKAQLPKSSKTLDFISNLRRFSVLSGINVIGKLAAYSATKLPTIGATEAVGGALSRLPKLSEISSRAPSEGGLSVRALATATAKGLTKGFEDAYQTLTKGQSKLKEAFSSRVDSAHAWYNIPQIFHEVIKSPLRRTAFELSLAKRMEFAAKNGADISDPIVQLGLAKDAYLDSDRALLLENNRFANGIRILMKNLEAKNKNTGQIPLGGKIGATIGRVELPILSVPLNYVKQTLMSAFGLVNGSIKARNAFKNGIENLSPQEADEILRHLKYGTIGGALLLYGFYDGYKNGGNGTLGGFYQPGEKRKDDQAGVNGIRIDGHNIPGLALHNPLIAVGQLGHTMGAILASKLNKKSDQTHSIPVATVAGLMGLLNQSPLGNTVELASQISDPRSAEYAMGEHVKGLLIPQLLQETANALDQQNGKLVKRNPQTITQHVETGIPGLRQTVKRK